MAKPSAAAGVTSFPMLSPDPQSVLLAALQSGPRKPASPMHDPAPAQQKGGGATRARQEESSSSSSSSSFAQPLQQEDFSPADLDLLFDDASYFDYGKEDGRLDGNTLVLHKGDGEANGIDGQDLFAIHDAEADADFGEKRKSTDDDEDDENDHKRRENDDKTSRKPGRKPLTSEPTTKRKAQNRAAQRAFRERKERHLKDLESKVNDLERASNSANHENGLLRAQIERMQDELRDYKRIMASGHSLGASPTNTALDFQLPKSSFVGGSSDFDFDFPKFGSLPGTNLPRTTDSSSAKTNGEFSHADSSDPSCTAGSESSPSTNTTIPGCAASYTVVDQLGNIFSPGFVEAIGDSNYDFSSSGSHADVADLCENEKRQQQQHQKGRSQSNSGSDASSPSASSVSQTCPSLFCGESPEPRQHTSPSGYGSTDSFSMHLPEIAQEHVLTKPPNLNFDWLANQNGGQFDPVLFGDYRESQDAIIGGGDFSGGFFQDAFGITDLDSSFNLRNFGIPDPVPNVKPIIEQVDRMRDGNAPEKRTVASVDEETVVPGAQRDLMTCHKIWNTLQTCPKFQAGELDIDSLCAELQTKARCSETGVVVPKEDVEAVLWRLTGQSGPRQAVD